MCSDEGKKASVKRVEIVIYWERKLPTLLVIITHLFVVSSRQRSIMIGEDVKNKFVAYCFIWNLAELHEVKIRNQRICQRH